MASLKNLWCNRAKPSFGSRLFFRAWAKRIILFPQLFAANSRRNRLVRKGAIIAENAEIGIVKIEGSKNKLSVGQFTFLGRVYMAMHGNITIGERVCINDGVEILTATHDLQDPDWKHVVRDIVIEDYVWIGTGAMILPGVKLGRGAVVGARAVVSKSVEAGAVVAGNPAKVLSKSRTEDLKYNPCSFLAVNNAWLNG